MGDITPTPTPTPDPKPAPAPETGSTQDQTDWKAEARKWEQRAKDNKSALDSATAERDTATGRVTELESSNSDLASKLSAFESKEAHNALVAKVAQEAGVDGSVLRGSTEAELRDHATLVKSLVGGAPVAPVVPKQGSTPEVKDNPEITFVKNLFDQND